MLIILIINIKLKKLLIKECQIRIKLHLLNISFYKKIMLLIKDYRSVILKLIYLN